MRTHGTCGNPEEILRTVKSLISQTHVSDRTKKGNSLGMSTATAKKKTNSEYSELLARVQEIPTLPAVAMRVNELINDPTSSSADIAEVLKKDQVLTAKILRLVNSSYYAIPGGVSDVQRALAFLGFNTLAQLVLGISVFSVFKNIDVEDFSMPEFWKHALATAICAESIAKKLKYPKPDEAFTCGLLHDIGKLVLNEVDPARLASIVRETKRRNCSFVDIEREGDLPGHSFLGEVIATKWGLPQIIRLAIHYHHFDVSKMASILGSAKPLIQMVRLANTIVVKNKIGNSGDWSDGEVTPDMILPLGLNASDVAAIEIQLGQDMERAGALLGAYR